MAKRSSKTDSELLKVGESPFEGITLSHVYDTGGKAYCVSWSPDGKVLAILLYHEIVFYDTIENRYVNSIKRDYGRFNHEITWSPDGLMVALGAQNDIHIINSINYKVDVVIKGHTKWINSLAFSSDSKRLASTSGDGTLQVWDVNTGEQIFEREFGEITANVFWVDGMETLAVNVCDGSLRIWNINELNVDKLSGWYYQKSQNSYAAFDGKDKIAIAQSNVIHIANLDLGKFEVNLEGHSGNIIGVSFLYEGRILASKSYDGTIKFWDVQTWDLMGTIKESHSNYSPVGIASNPAFPLFASFGKNDSIIRIWEISENVFATQSKRNSIRYTTAKLVLVGDSGVGKTGLGWRLAHNQYKEHDSTHGQQFWKVEELGVTNNDGTICESVLWDLAGQPDYRLVHSLFLDNVNIAMVVFDPTKRQDSLSAPLFWINQLKKEKKVVCPIILVGARSDTGTSTLTKEELELFCKQNDIYGGYILTSAKENTEIDTLKSRIKDLIPWESLNITITNSTFKKIKDYVLQIKEDATKNMVLISPLALRKELELLDSDWQFTDDEMLGSVRNLENHGFVNVLHDSKGATHFLLQPAILANLASSFVLEARRNPRGLGVLEEERLLNGNYFFAEVSTLNWAEREILLDTTIVLFIEHAICFRENFNAETLLVFPSLINEKRPLIEEVEVFEDVSYKVTGPIENVYASLVVLLGYTNVFVRNNQWQNQAQYQVAEGEICGFKQISNIEGEVEFVLYYSANVSKHIKSLFQGLFERFLNRNDLVIQRYTPVLCGKCKEVLDRNVMMQQLGKGRNFSHCSNCGRKLTLSDPEKVNNAIVHDENLKGQQKIATRRTAYEAALVKVKGLLRGAEKNEPTSCFVSYSWGIQQDEEWVLRFANDLRKAGIDVLFDRWHNPPGTSISSYIEKILSSGFSVVIGTPLLKEKYESKSTDPVVSAELKLINTRLRQPSKYGCNVIPMLLKGDQESSFTPMLQDVVFIDFRNEEYYFYNLLAAIWTLYQLPFDSQVYLDIQKTLKPS